MRTLQISILVLLVTFTTGCSHYSDITGKVVDSATGKPIEGAIVVAQWTQFHGWLGEQQRDLHKIIETSTDKEGKFSLSGTVGFVLDPPEMIIYKEGYIPWRNDSIFPDKKKQEHEWKNNVTYKLSAFNSQYSARQIWQFMDSGIIGRGGNETPLFTNLMHNLQ